jgi:hypothetical protein
MRRREQYAKDIHMRIKDLEKSKRQYARLTIEQKEELNRKKREKYAQNIEYERMKAREKYARKKQRLIMLKSQ